MPAVKFGLTQNRLTVHGPILIGGADGEEDVFLQYVESLMGCRQSQVTLDLASAGSLSSTVLALCIAACRRADDAGKGVKIRLHRRNATAVNLVGLNRLAEVELI